MKVPIDKDIPFVYQQKENARGGFNGRNLFPWVDMEVGDSFLFRETATFRDLLLASQHVSKRSTKEITFLKAEHEGGVRIWRVR